MSEVVVALSWRAALVSGGWCCFKRESVELSRRWRCNQLRVMKIEAQMVNPSTFSSRISTDVPLYEIPGASFDQYLEDKPRVFEAICPDKLRSQQINEQVQEEWRVEMTPIQFPYLSVSPVVDMRLRLKSRGIEYPPQIPPHISKLLHLEITRCQLEGLDDIVDTPQFCLTVEGALYPDRSGSRSRLKGQLQMNIGIVLPQMLSFLPQNLAQGVAETVLKGLLENIKHKASRSLIADYDEFKKEMCY